MPVWLKAIGAKAGKFLLGVGIKIGFKRLVKRVLAGVTKPILDWFYWLGAEFSTIGKKAAKKAGSEKAWNTTVEPFLGDCLDKLKEGWKSN